MAVTTANGIWEIQKSLNVLAGTTLLDAQAAANVWAGTSHLELIEALNHKNGQTHPPFLDFNAVCNALASTTLREGQDALSKLAGGGYT